MNKHLEKISIATPSAKKSPFDFSSDYHSTCGFGETQPLKCELLVPGTKSVCKLEGLVRAAPLACPTIGRMKFKLWHNFVALSDLSRNFAALLAKTSVNRGGTTFIPSQVPHTECWMYSAQVVDGARCTIYQVQEENGYIHWRTPSALTEEGTCSSWIQAFENAGILEVFNANPRQSYFHYGKALGRDDAYSNLFVKLDNVGKKSFFGDYLTPKAIELNATQVTPENYDICIPVNVHGAEYVMCFSLSARGQRLRKILIGLGLPIDLSSDSKWSLMPLFAYYKSYFDVFGLTLYSNYDTTNCARLLNAYDLTNGAFLTPLSETVRNFFNDMANCWVTEDVDYVSSHIDSTAVSPQFGLSQSFVDVTGVAGIQEVDSSQGAPTDAGSYGQNGVNGHAFINAINHGALDEEYLKTLYRWTNKNTIAGKAIAKVLRAHGLGAYVDSTKTNFIGYEEQLLNVDDVVSMSDTLEDGKGRALGEYAGKGLSYHECKPLVFENDEFGYWICFGALVPDAGYCQSADMRNAAIIQSQFYQPEFDSKGMEAHPKRIVCGSSDFASRSSDNVGNLDETFGFSPRFSAWKFSHNVANGDFTRRGRRTSFLPYITDKFIPVNDVIVHPSGTTGRDFQIRKALNPSALPIASLAYRYPTRYPWLGNYERIFAYTNSEASQHVQAGVTSAADWELFAPTEDNFILHFIFNFVAHSPMKARGDSYETDEDGFTNYKMDKA